jgi:hypothetical protein
MSKQNRAAAESSSGSKPLLTTHGESVIVSAHQFSGTSPRGSSLKPKDVKTTRRTSRTSTQLNSIRRPRRPVIPILAFTPSNQDPVILEELFVRREGLLQELQQDVAEFIKGGSRRHRLLVGPRGIGKSHLIALLNHRVTADATAISISVHMLSEDLYGIKRFADLVDSILDRDPRPSSTDAEAENELRVWAATKPMLILLENLDSVLEAIGTNGVRRLRSAIEDSRILLIATAPLLFDDVRNAKKPLFGFFDTIHLDELSLDNALELMRRVAKLRGDEELLTFLDTPQALSRAAAVQALAGGQPRIWMLFTGCLSVEALDELVPLFLKSLDDLTPYYQDRIRSLSPQLQKIVMLFFRRGSALSNKDIAVGTGIDERRVASAMKDLERMGYVRRPISILESVCDERGSWWDLREPLMRLSFDGKASRGKPLRTIVEFLKLWYGLDLYLVPENSVGTTANKYITAALEEFDPSTESPETLSTFANTLSDREKRIVKTNIRERAQLYAGLKLEMQAVPTDNPHQQKILKLSKSILRSIVSNQTDLPSSSKEIAGILANAINSGVETSALLRTLKVDQRRLALGLVLAIPGLGPVENTNIQLEKIVKELEADDYGELGVLFAPVVSWMKSRQLTQLMKLPVEWRQLIEPLLAEWVKNSSPSKVVEARIG